MRFAVKELLYGKKKYILIELLLILLMFMVLFLSGLSEGLGRAVTSGIENREADYYLVSDSSEKLITVSELPYETLDKVKKQTNSEVAPLDIQRMYLQKQGEETKINVTYFAIDPDSFLMPNIIEGNNLTNSNTEYPIVLNDDFKAEGITVGDTVKDSYTEIVFKVVGFTKDEMYGHVSVGFITTDSYTKLRNELNPYYEKHFHAIAIKGNAENIDIDGTLLVSKQEIIESVPSYSAEHLTITMIVYVLVVVSAVVIGIFYYILTIQKHRQFGVMKAIGFDMKKLSGIVICQVLILSVFSAVVANILTFGMSVALPQTMPFYLLPVNACAVSVAFVLISVISSLLSVINISRIDPIQIIGGNDE